MKTLKIKMTDNYNRNDEQLFLVDTYYGDYYYGSNIWTYKEIKFRHEVDKAELVWLDEELQEKPKTYDYDDDDIF